MDELVHYYYYYASEFSILLFCVSDHSVSGPDATGPVTDLK